jgi:hypothetical protein
VVGWMDGRESRVKDCLQQSTNEKVKRLTDLNSTTNQEGAVRIIGKFPIGGLPVHCSHIPSMVLHPIKEIIRARNAPL